ncbi:MAG: undecaprenyl diphosphate synthase family protein [Archaeoglobaceae archaeon]|nr:undecaprenyl diphosphate synthase family protein [Archaeoglobaceae archaeon]MCX8152195.1 undecaprenyl diphosphate synthase family protein [Archaeoglobaceae archaeon]MDW8013911.1 undecaprenyl diphosphate synthase family protein [Archaeoglobaceae archaeon]
MLRKVYAKKLESEIKKVPRHVVIVADKIEREKFLEFVDWVKKFKIKELTLCLKEKIEIEFSDLKAFVRVVDEKIFEFGKGDLIVNFVFFDGKREIANAFRKLAEKVLAGEIDPEKVNEEIIEEHLAIKSQPDMIIKVGKEIPGFLIWQSIYSELFFADVDWKNFRYIDFLRMLREYQRRERRYGR